MGRVKLASFIIAFVVIFLINACAAQLKAINNAEQKSKAEEELKLTEKEIKALIDFLLDLRLIDKNFFDKNYNLDEFLEGACRGAVKAVDKYGDCISNEEYLKRSEDFAGEFGGIGITAQKNKKDLIEIIEVYGGAPAYQILESGDIILEANNESLINKELDDVIRLVRGPEDTEVTLKIYRPKTDKELIVKIVRKKIEIPNVIFQSINEEVNYIRILSFNEKTSDLVNEALSKSENTKTIVDLRNNPGGLVSSVEGVASLFLKNDSIIYIMKDRDGNEEKIFSNNEKFLENKIIVLINRNSASGSELFAAAIKDNKRGLLVGEKTFGKGSVQSHLGTIFGVPIFERIIILTTHRFLSPNGHDIEDKGVEPDVEIEEPENFKIGDVKTDIQLQKAIEILQNQ